MKEILIFNLKEEENLMFKDGLIWSSAFDKVSCEDGTELRPCQYLIFKDSTDKKKSIPQVEHKS